MQATLKFIIALARPKMPSCCRELSVAAAVAANADVAIAAAAAAAACAP